MSAAVVLSHRTSSAQRDAIDAACTRAELACVRWRTGDPPPVSPVLIIASLEPGHRSIPADVLELAAHGGAEASVLLFASEDLARPTVTLHDGRVVIVHELHADRLYNAVCLLTMGAKHRGQSVRPRWFSGELNPDAPVADVSGDTLTAMVSLTPDAPKADVTSAGQSAALGDRVGIVHLRADATRWVASWPAAVPSRGALWLYSATRLPRLFDVADAARSMHPHVLAMQANPGDILLALAEGIDRSEDEIEHLMADGAPVLLQRLRQDHAPQAGSGGVVVEIRG